MPVFRRYIVFVICFASLNSIAQDNYKDSLVLSLYNKKTKADTNKVNLLCKLSRLCSNADALKYAEDAYELSKKLNYKKGIAQSNAYIGKYYFLKEEFVSSLKYCANALKIAQENGYNDIAAFSLLYIGYNHAANQPEKALDYYFRSLAYSLKTPDKILEPYTLSAIGNIYEGLKYTDSCYKYFSKSLEIRKRGGNTDHLISSLIEMSRANNLMGQYDKSNELIKKGIELAEQKKGDPQNLVYLYQMAGFDLEGRLKDYKGALAFFLKSYDLVNANHLMNQNNLGSIRPIANIYMKLGDYKKASEYYKLLLDLLEENQKKINKELYKTQYGLSKEEEKQEEMQESSEALKQSIKIHKLENSRNLFIAGTIVFLLLAFFVLRSNLIKKRTNLLLEEKVKQRTAELDEINNTLRIEIRERQITSDKLKDSETKLTEANKELEAFVFRASHDLKGPLTAAKGLVNLALTSTDPVESAKILAMISISMDKLNTILIELYEVTIIRQGSVLLKKINIKKLISDLTSNFSGYSNFNKIKFNIDNQLKDDLLTDEILILTILRNLLENAVKYSKPDIEDPYVNITITENQDRYYIQISDNGIGISPEFHEKIFDVFFRATDTNSGSGLGLYIVKNAVNKLHGEIEIASSEKGVGTTFNLYLPKA